MVRPDEPQPTFPDAAHSIVKRETAAAQRARFSTISYLAFIGSFLVVVLIIAVAVEYLWERKRPHRSATIVAETPGPSVALGMVSMAPETGPNFIQITPEMLHVSAIALGRARLAIVNGKELGEGDSLALSTADGVVTLRVVKISDGAVRFKNGAQFIDAKLETAIGQKKPH